MQTQSTSHRNTLILLLISSVLCLFCGASFLFPAPIIALYLALGWGKKGLISQKFTTWIVIISTLLAAAMVIDLTLLKPVGPTTSQYMNSLEH